MSFMLTIAMLVITLLVVRISHWLYRWSNPKCNGKLPPGSMGFPIIGETAEFFKPFGLFEISPFVKKRMLRYGALSRTNILGSNTVISTDPDLSFEILKQENKSFILAYPDRFKNITVKDNLLYKEGKIDIHFKQFSRQLLGSEGLKQKMIAHMDRVTHEHLTSMAKEGIYDVRDGVSSMITSYLTPKMISNLKPETQAKLVDNFRAFNFDWFRGSFNLSAWKALYRFIRAQREAMQMIRDAFRSRKASKDKYGDFLDSLIEEFEKDGTVINEETALSLVFIIAIVSQETTPAMISLAVKFLSENPKVLAELKRENEAIIEKRGDKESGVSWEEYRHHMSFTNMVINETLRLGSLAPFLFRKAVKDVEIKGYTIPAGWSVVLSPAIVHYNPLIYENPFEFNPWRWEGKEVFSGSKTFWAFGGGMRLCPGAEFARLQMAIFLHHLATKYNFSLLQHCEIIRTPMLYFPEGLRIRISSFLK